MNRPSPGDFAGCCRPTTRDAHADEIRAVDDAIEREDYDDGPREAARAEAASSARSRVWQELEGGLAPEAYWRAATWRRLTAIFAGPAVNLVFAIVLFTALFIVAAERETNIVGAGAGRLAGGRRTAEGRTTTILAVGGESVTPKDIPAHIRATHGRPVKLLVSGTAGAS